MELRFHHLKQLNRLRNPPLPPEKPNTNRNTPRGDSAPIGRNRPQEAFEIVKKLPPAEEIGHEFDDIVVESEP